MEKCNCLCEIFAQINWWAFGGSVLLVFAVGALWYSVLFAKAWKEVNKIDDTGEISAGNMVFTMLFQLLSTALVGLTFFILTKVSLFLAILVAVAIIGWMKSTLKFRFTNWKIFFKAVVSEVGYFAVAALIFILFACI